MEATREEERERYLRVPSRYRSVDRYRSIFDLCFSMRVIIFSLLGSPAFKRDVVAKATVIYICDVC